MLEHIDFNENEIEVILKYYKTLVFMFQDCLKQEVYNLSDEYKSYSDEINDIASKVEEIEFIDEIEIISDKFDNFVERFKYRIINDYVQGNNYKIDFFNNFYLLVQANAIKNIILFALDQSWKNKESKKEVLHLNDFINILKNYISTTAKDIVIQNERDKFFDGDTLYFLKLLSNPDASLSDVIVISDKIIESCDGDGENNYNVIDELINDINNTMHTLYQEYINKILAINIYAICIEELLKTMS